MLFSHNALRGCQAAALVAVSMLAAASGAMATPISGEWQARWEEDLRFAQEQAVERHPDLFHTLSRDEWNREFDGLIERLPSLEHHEAAVELARIIARLEDGHSRLTLPLSKGIDFMQGHSKTPDPHLPELLFRQYPVRFSIDSGGVYVRRIAAAHPDALGGRVSKLGRLDIEAAIAAVSATIRRDNDMQVKHHLPVHLVLAEVLHARGVVEDMQALRLEVVAGNGRSVTRMLHPVAHGDPVEWVDASDGNAAPPPLYLRQPERRFWFEHLKGAHTVYFQLNAIQNDENESLRNFATRLERYLEENTVENLIVDLRNNRGGNNRLARPLLHSILRSRVNRTGHVFVLIGRTTFSAAMMFALQMEKHTKALFVGERSGSSPNHYGDSRKIRLPNTGMTLRTSTRYWQYHPTDGRYAIAPHIPVELASDDYRENRDPVVDTVLGIIAARKAGRGTATGQWRGIASLGLNAFDLGLGVRSVPSPSISVELPDLEIDTFATNVRIEGRTIAFETEFRERPIRWSGAVAGDWLIGEGEYRTVLFPFVLRVRSAAAAPTSATGSRLR